jgi:hypothetical protein
MNDKGSGQYRKLDNKELLYLYRQSGIKTVESRRLQCSGHVARILKTLLVGKPLRKHPPEDSGDGIITLRWILWRYFVRIRES